MTRTAIHDDGTFKGWIPTHYLDEVVPDQRASPDDWLLRGDVVHLAPADDEDGRGTVVAPDEIVVFAGLTVFPQIAIMILGLDPLRYKTLTDVSSNAKQFWLLGDMDTMGYGLDDFVEYNIDHLEIGIAVHVDCYDWSDRSFQLRDGTFVEVPVDLGHGGAP